MWWNGTLLTASPTRLPTLWVVPQDHAASTADDTRAGSYAQCLNRDHGADCSVCSMAPEWTQADLYELVGDKGCVSSAFSPALPMLQLAAPFFRHTPATAFNASR